MVPFDDERSIVFADGGAPLDHETAQLVEGWLTGAQGQWRPASDPAAG
jgi:hypothetical protein